MQEYSRITRPDQRTPLHYRSSGPDFKTTKNKSRVLHDLEPPPSNNTAHLQPKPHRTRLSIVPSRQRIHLQRPQLPGPPTPQIPQMLLDMELPSLAPQRSHPSDVASRLAPILAARTQPGRQDVESRQPQFPWLGVPQNGHRRPGRQRPARDGDGQEHDGTGIQLHHPNDRNQSI